ncbi:alpha/beta hydrolase [Pseudolysinimonas sp.]|uniref:alpha/beta hydrolase n=1 Tax=Pseudolysinimonas sp. TaxID=2680009 RepID=UPI003F7F13A3
MTPAVALDVDAIRWSASPEARLGRPLLLAMHGRVSGEQRLVAASAAWPEDYVIAHLRAPWPEDDRWSWFAADNERGDPRPEDAIASADAVLGWLATLPPPPLVGAGGFSQGGAMALELLRRDPDRVAFAVNLGGFSVRGDRERDAELRERRPPVFWGRGGMDDVIRPSAIDRTTAWLDAHATTTARLYPRLRHTVSRREAEDAGAFLRERLGGGADERD